MFFCSESFGLLINSLNLDGSRRSNAEFGAAKNVMAPWAFNLPYNPDNLINPTSVVNRRSVSSQMDMDLLMHVKNSDAQEEKT